MHSLPLFHRVAGQPVIVVGEGDAAQAKRRMVERAGAHVVGIDDRHARLAFVALEDAEQCEALARELRSRAVLVNVVDQPALCDFTVPALVERDPLLVAIATGGASAGLAKAVRLRIERWLPPAAGALAAALGSARGALRAHWPDAGERRRALDQALGEGGPLDPFSDGASDRVQTWLDSPHDEQPGRVEIIRLRSGDPDDLTLREARLLGSADVVRHDGRVPTEILDRARADARRELLVDTAESISAPSGALVVVIHGPESPAKR